MAAKLTATMLALTTFGCASRIDMTKAYDPSRAATTIEYSGVREVSRQNADYGTIDAKVLTGEERAKRTP